MRCLSCHAEGIPTTVELCPHCGISLTSLLRDVLPPGTLLSGGAYRLDYALGRGGFGITYRAMHTLLEQTVAIKEFYPQEHVIRDSTTGHITVAPKQAKSYRHGVERFMREGKILARLSHPHVIQVKNLFEERGTAYLVMDFISGQTLQDLLDAQQPDHRLPEVQVEDILEQLVDALAAVHKAGVFHLDLKPENVLLTSDGQVRLIDFGAARQGFSSSRSQAFSPPYAAPEVLTGHEVGPESDIFELGMLLHEMLTGQPPAPAMNRLLRDTWQPTEVEEPWRGVITAALPLQKEDRPHDVRELLQILSRGRHQEQIERLLSPEMRCLHCQQDGVPVKAPTCPHCKVHLPSLMRDVLPQGSLLQGKVYMIDYPLGRGGFGVTYRAVNTTLEQFVAIKEFYPQEHAVREGTTGRLTVAVSQQEVYRRGLQRFVREGRILAKLNHPNVVRVLYLFEERGTAYLVMELVTGQTLRQILDNRPEGCLPEVEVQVIMEQLVSALDAVHQAGILHLDLKPENILMTPQGRAILVDFGAARQGFSSRTTRAFTLEYAPPELLAGQEVGPESDLFELGVVLHELLTGERPAPALNRLGKDTWSAEGVAIPWQNLLKTALTLTKEARPDNVKAWWEASLITSEPPKGVRGEDKSRGGAKRPKKTGEAKPAKEKKAPTTAVEPSEKAAAPVGVASENLEKEPTASGKSTTAEETLKSLPKDELKSPTEAPQTTEKEAESAVRPVTGPICPKCRHTNRVGMKFCENCATPLMAEQITCARCHYLNRSGVKFCENCGSPLAESPLVCPKCRHTNRPEVKFCENCGTALAKK